MLLAQQDIQDKLQISIFLFVRVELLFETLILDTDHDMLLYECIRPYADVHSLPYAFPFANKPTENRT